MAQAINDNIPEHPAVATARLRADMQTAVDRLLAALDVMEAPDVDKEDDDPGGAGAGEDDEPSLGAPENLRGRRNSSARWGEGDQTTWGASGDADLEGPDDDLEPSLGFPGALFGTGGMCGASSMHGADDDRENDPGGEGGIGDDGGLAEQTKGEPSLGSFDRMLNQTKSYLQRETTEWYVEDAEQDNADREDSDPVEAKQQPLEMI